MSRLLFYSPMHPPAPGAPPSGDRAMAGLIARALGETGFAVESASSLRAYEGRGDGSAQQAIADAGEAEAARLIASHRARPPAAWVTYLTYYKAPDHLGPRVSRALGIPYLIVEASHAPKRAAGDFAAPYAAARDALESANAVVAMTAHDAAGLARLVAPDRLHRLDPFIDAAPFLALKRLVNRTPIILSVAMLRPGKKLDNFPLIAAALAQLADLDWHYLVAGDGDGRAEAEAPFAGFPPGRITFAGAFPQAAMPQIYARADLFLWPGLKEGYGLSYLEAQATGLPVIACDTAGVPAVVVQGRGGLLSPAGHAPALAQNLRILLANRQTRDTMGEVARDFVRAERTIAHAARKLSEILQKTGVTARPAAA